jgi:hypothetical protein
LTAIDQHFGAMTDPKRTAGNGIVGEDGESSARTVI